MADESNIRKRLREALQNTTEDAACDTCLSGLPKYVEAQLDGRNLLAEFPRIANHLDGCLQCAAAYARLYRLERTALADTLPELERPRQADLSFLPPHSAPIPSLGQRLKDAFTEIQSGLRLQLTADLLPGLQPPMVLVPTRAAEDERYAELLYALDSRETVASAAPFKLAVYRDAEQIQNCLVEVTVGPPGRAWPQLGDIRVTLELADSRREGLTNHWGVAAFDAIPAAELGSLTVEVQL